jgi:protoporphyrinogen oxidase
MVTRQELLEHLTVGMVLSEQQPDMVAAFQELCHDAEAWQQVQQAIECEGDTPEGIREEAALADEQFGFLVGAIGMYLRAIADALEAKQALPQSQNVTDSVTNCAAETANESSDLHPR